MLKQPAVPAQYERIVLKSGDHDLGLKGVSDQTIFYTLRIKYFNVGLLDANRLRGRIIQISRVRSQSPVRCQLHYHAWQSSLHCRLQW